MKKVVYGTIIIFLAILLIVIVVAERNSPHTVTYKNGRIIEDE